MKLEPETTREKGNVTHTQQKETADPMFLLKSEDENVYIFQKTKLPKAYIRWEIQNDEDVYIRQTQLKFRRSIDTFKTPQ